MEAHLAKDLTVKIHNEEKVVRKVIHQGLFVACVFVAGSDNRVQGLASC